MSRKPPDKPYWKMDTDELRKATQEFDEEFVADKAKPLTPAMRAQLKLAKGKSGSIDNGSTQQVIAVHLDRNLVVQCTALAKKKRISRDALISRGLKALLAAEGKE